MKTAQSRSRLRLLVLTSLAILALLLPAVAMAAPAEASMESASQWSGCSTYHTVRYGETLSGIARLYGVSTSALMAANNISNPSRIFAGQSLCIPTGGSSGGSSSGCSTIHTVTFGQTLSGIAQYYGVSAWSIMQANGMTDPNHIWIGQQLCIPGGSAPAPVPPSSGCWIWYTVAPGDTLTKIAGWYGTTVSQIMWMNGITNPNHIYVGQVLKVPTACDVPAQPPTWPQNPCNPCAPVPPPPPVNPCNPCAPVPPPPPVNPCNPCAPVAPPVNPCNPCVPVYPTPVPTPVPQPTPIPSGPWFAEYFNNSDMSGGPSFTTSVEQVGFNWGTGGPGGGISGSNFSARFSRQDWLKAGVWRFYATSDDGIRVFVDNQLVIDGWKIQAPTTYFGDVSVGEGYHNIRVEYFQQGGEALLFVNYVCLQ